MKGLKSTKINIAKNIANLSIYLMIFILLMSLIIDKKVLFDLILLDGVIAIIGFIILITEKENKIKGENGVG